MFLSYYGNTKVMNNHHGSRHVSHGDDALVPSSERDPVPKKPKEDVEVSIVTLEKTSHIHLVAK